MRAYRSCSSLATQNPARRIAIFRDSDQCNTHSAVPSRPISPVAAPRERLLAPPSSRRRHAAAAPLRSARARRAFICSHARSLRRDGCAVRSRASFLRLHRHFCRRRRSPRVLMYSIRYRSNPHLLHVHAVARRRRRNQSSRISVAS